ncbi:MAG: DUF4012 domain-containing protein [Halobacteriota archaeon]
MNAHGSSRTRRYVALALIVVIIAVLLLPTFDALSVAGFFGDKTYLIILQDNAEIRSTGGLMTVMGVLTTHDGNIASLEYRYWNSSQQTGIVALDGPESFTKFFGVNAAVISDSNVQYDFASFAPKMRSDFYNVTGKSVDGIVALDLTAVEALMNVTGPITTSDGVITSRNVADRLHYYAGSAEGSDKTSLTSLLSTLTHDLFRQIRDASIPQKLALLGTLRTLEAEKHVLLYPSEGFLFRNAGGEPETRSGDFISTVDITLGTAKADFDINRAIDYRVALLADGSAVANLTISYDNHNFWDYNVFSTTLVPAGAELVSVRNSTNAFKGPLITSDDGLTAISSRTLVAADSNGSVTYNYKIPNVVSSNGIGYRYDLTVQKQAGIVHYVLSVSVQLPPGATAISTENVGSDMVLTEDAHMSVVYR